MNEILGGRYRLIKRLGAGGMAEVFLAEQSGARGFARQTVIKRILMHRAEEPIFIKSFEDEARLAAKLQHPNIVRTEDFGDEAGQLYLALEYVPGEDLDSLSRSAEGKNCGLPLPVILQAGVDIAEALNYAHRLADDDGSPLQVVHRDVSPHNIMVTPDGEAKLLDFGIARATSNQEHTQAGKVKGKAAYFCPEQARGDLLDGRGDQFALAIVLYELLARRRLFLDISLISTLQSVVRCEVPSLERFRSDLPPIIESVLRRALSRDCERRFGDCAEFADALRNCLEACGGRWTPRVYAAWREQFLEGVTPKTMRRLKPIVSEAGTGDPLASERPTLVAEKQPGFDEGITELSVPPLSVSEALTSEITKPGLSGAQSNLTSAIDTFFGRQDELKDLEERITQGQRLISLLGPGGIGKTRLAQQFAAQQVSRFAGGVWFCDLSEVHHEQGIIASVAAAIDLPLSQEDPAQQLARALAGRGRVLLLLDNFEQLRAFAEGTLALWLTQAPNAVFLVTSEVRLGLTAESSLLLEPLPLAEAMRLFFARAQMVQADFEPTDTNEPVVRDIVERLDRMPLAIELAAARIRVMPPATIRERLSQRFRLLRSQHQDHSQRRATLRGTIEWSWNLLAPAEQHSLAQLSVFHAGFTLDAAEAVLKPSEGADDSWVIDDLTALVDHSLLARKEPREGHCRYHLLESVRAFAAEKLGDDEALCGRHARFFAQLGSADHLASMNRAGGADRRAALREELENLLAGIEGAAVVADPEAGAGCALAAGYIFEVQGPARDGIPLVQAVLARGPNLTLSAALQRQLGVLLQIIGRNDEAREALEASMQGATGYIEMLAQGALGRLHYQLGDALRALEYFESGTELAASSGDFFHRAMFLSTTGFLFQRQGDSAEATRRFDLALQFARDESVGNQHAEAAVLCNMATLSQERGHNQEALACYQVATAIHRREENRRFLGIPLVNMAGLYHQLGQLDEALATSQEALRLSRELGLVGLEGVIRGNLGGILRDRGDAVAGEKSLRDAIELCDRHMPDASGAFSGILAVLLAGVGQFDEADQCLRRGEPALRGFNQFGLGAFLARAAQVHGLAGDQERAISTYREAQQIAEELAILPGSEIDIELKAAQRIIDGLQEMS